MGMCMYVHVRSTRVVCRLFACACVRAYGLPPDLGLWLATARAVCTLLRFMGFSGPRQCNEAAVLHVGRRLHVAPLWCAVRVLWL